MSAPEARESMSIVSFVVFRVGSCTSQSMETWTFDRHDPNLPNLFQIIFEGFGNRRHPKCILHIMYVCGIFVT